MLRIFLTLSLSRTSPAMAAIFTTRRILSSLLSRSLSSTLRAPRSRFALAILNNQPQLVPDSVVTIPTRCKTSGPRFSYFNVSSPIYINGPLVGNGKLNLKRCDHWLIHMDYTPGQERPSKDEMVNSYVKTLAKVVGSEEEAKKKIYQVWETSFGALISEKLSRKIEGLPGVWCVSFDPHYFPKKKYGGDLYIDGKVIHRP